MKTYIFYSKFDKNCEALDRIQVENYVLALEFFSARKNLSISDFKKLYEVIIDPKHGN